MIRLGITGNIACGKSLVGSILQELGYPVIDSDKIVHQLLAEDNAVSKKIIEICHPHSVVSLQAGKHIIDRRKLGAIFFSNRDLKVKIERIIHPEVFSATAKFFKEKQKEGFLLAADLIPLLFENNAQNHFDRIWLVYCKKTVQRERLKARNPELSDQDIESRMTQQMNQELKKDLADYIIDNSSTVDKTKAQVKIALEKTINLNSKTCVL